MRYNPESILEDFFIPVRGDRGSRIETLPGGEVMPLQLKILNIYRTSYLFLLEFESLILPLKKIFQASQPWLKKILSLLRTIQRIQKIVVSELAKISLVHLYLRGYDESSIYNFDLRLTNPSTVTEMMHLELMG